MSCRHDTGFEPEGFGLDKKMEPGGGTTLTGSYIMYAGEIGIKQF